jgi:Holliday junction DNA helicase RuvB
MATLKPSDYEALTRMASFEGTMNEEQKRMGWSWQDVKVYPATIQKLMLADLVKLTYSSNRYKNYMLTEKGHLIATGIDMVEEEQEESTLDVDGLFGDIVGYDDTKELLRECLLADDPIHVLLVGPPSLSKTMFLDDIEKATGHQSLPLFGSGTSLAGMWDLIIERKPRYILIDEIEKMKAVDQAGLLGLMASQRIIRAKVGRMIEEEVHSRVIAAANVTRGMSPPLLSRFWKRHLKEYNSKEFVEVVKAVLVRREGLSEDAAHQIALGLVGKTHDVRDAVNVARLSKRVGVERALQIFCS